MKKIPIIDDEPAIVNLCIDLFTREGFTAIGAANGTEGITLARMQNNTKEHIINYDETDCNYGMGGHYRRCGDAVYFICAPWWNGPIRMPHMQDELQEMGIALW